MIGWILPLIARLGVPQGLQRLVGWVTLAAGAIAVLGLLWAVHGWWVGRRIDAAVERDRIDARAQAIEQARRADQVAGAAKADRDAAFTNEQAQLEKEVDDAADNGTSPLDALFGRLRD